MNEEINVTMHMALEKYIGEKSRERIIQGKKNPINSFSLAAMIVYFFPEMCLPLVSLS